MVDSILVQTETIDENLEDAKDTVVENVSDLTEKVQDMAESAKDAVVEKISEIKEAAEDKASDFAKKASEVKEAVDEKVEEAQALSESTPTELSPETVPTETLKTVVTPPQQSTRASRRDKAARSRLEIFNQRVKDAQARREAILASIRQAAEKKATQVDAGSETPLPDKATVALPTESPNP